MKKARGGNNYCPRSLFFAHQIFAGFIVVFGIRLLWPLLMALGLVPIIGEELPFIGYSGSAQILDFAAVGLLMSIYRRKNMIPGEMEVTA